MKEKRYTLQEEQPTPIGWHPANEKEAVGLKPLKRSMKGQVLAIMKKSFSIN